MSDIPPGSPYQQPPGYSNYPRDSQMYDPNGRPPGIYFDYFSQAAKIVQSDLGTWVGSVLIAGIIIGFISIGSSLGINFLLYGSILGGQGNFEPIKFGASMGAGLIPGMVVSIFVGSLQYMGLKHARGEPIAIGDIFSGFSCAGYLMLASLLMGIATNLGYLCLIVPGIFLTGALAFTPLLIIDQKLSTIEALQRSFETLKTHAWAMFALMFVLGLILLLGYCACLIGLLFAVPVYLVTMGLTYNNFFPRVMTVQYYGQPMGTEPPR